MAFGLKARLSRLLSHPAVLGESRALMARRGVHVIRLSRRNRIKQTARRVPAAACGPWPAPCSVLRAPCSAADASEAAPRLTHDYEQLLGAHEATLERVRAFLRLAPPPPPAAADAAADIRTVCQGDARQAVRGGEQLWRAVHRVRRGRRRRVRALSRRAVRLRRARGGCGTAGAAQRYVAGVTEPERERFTRA